MDGTGRFCLAVGVVLVLGVLPGSHGKQCVGVGPCMCVFDDGSGTADLTTTGNNDGTAKYADYTALHDTFLYSYNPCFPFTQGSCTDAAMCQSDGSQLQSWKTGDQSSATWSYDGSNIQIYYSANTDVFRESFITAICDPTSDEPLVEILGEQNFGSAQYYAQITTKCACPDGCHTTAKVDIEISISGGSILLITFIVVMFVYLVGGVTYNRYVRHNTGRELMPNSSFWGALPGLVKDGCSFVIGRVRGGGGQKTSYQNI